MAATVPNGDAITCWGTIINAAWAFVDERAPDARRRVLARLSPETRTVAGGTILASSHYPLKAMVELLEAIDAELGDGNLLLAWEVGRFAAGYEVNLLHKVFLAIGKLEFWFNMAGTMWRTYYSAGHFSADHFTHTGGRTTLRDFNPISKAFCYRFAGWQQRICELAKLKDVRIDHTACVLDGDEACSWEGTWRKD
jgi:hypothetical protein